MDENETLKRISEVSLQGKVVVITGSTAGLGAALVNGFLLAGAKVYGLDSREPIGHEKNNRLYYIKTDVSSERQVGVAFHEIYQNSGEIHLLINNAGINYRAASLETVGQTQVETIFSVNVFGAIYCAREYLKYMRAKNYGNILNVSSVAATRGNELESLYTSTKWALRGLTMSWAREMAPFNIAVNEIEPGIPIATAMSEIAYDDATKKVWRNPSEIVPAFLLAGLNVLGGQRVTGQHFVASTLINIR